jgi:hypothetical protein
MYNAEKENDSFAQAPREKLDPVAKVAKVWQSPYVHNYHPLKWFEVCPNLEGILVASYSHVY